jgi:dipeptidyl aminopeptidase/acylaminoacyl peptidase
MHRIESFLSARQFLVPQLAGDQIYFVSNMNGRLSLYRMPLGGGLPEPLLPPEIALQNPHLIGNLYQVIPGIGKILIMLDKDGNEDYKPMFIPLDGGYPEPVFTEGLEQARFFLGRVDRPKNLAYIGAASHTEARNDSYQLDLKSGERTHIFTSKYGAGGGGFNQDHTKVVLIQGYSVGDNILYLWDKASGEVHNIYGTPIEERSMGQGAELNSIHSIHFVRDEHGLIFHTTLFEDGGGLGFLDLDGPAEVKPAFISGELHEGTGEFDGLSHLKDDRYLAHYNIDGSDWVYEGRLDEDSLTFHCEKVLVGQGELSGGVLESLRYTKSTDSMAISFSTAVSPTQIYTLKGPERQLKRHTNERLLGLNSDLLSEGEDYPFVSHDGLRCSARMYLPAKELGFSGPRPLVYYIHGGPQGQERPDFAWFSMPLIQFLTLNGFAVFVPNVRGSTGYGLKYTKMVDRDWGGQDRLDHVHAMTQVLPKDERIDTRRTGVVGRSYGGYMTLTLASRHPELWAAACDMFGPYDLLTFSDRIPETWKPYFKIALGDPEIPEEKAFLVERSPKTYFDQIQAPMMVIQGKNDPRVVEQESRDVVDYLNSIGKEVEYLMFENEGHDVIKFENKVRCYNAITEFFVKHLGP